MWLFTIYKYEQVCQASHHIASHWKHLWNQIGSSKASPHQGQCGTRYWSGKNVFCAGMKQAAQFSCSVQQWDDWDHFLFKHDSASVRKGLKYEHLTDTLGALMATPFSNPEINWTETASDAFSSAITAWLCKCSTGFTHAHRHIFFKKHF